MFGATTFTAENSIYRSVAFLVWNTSVSLFAAGHPVVRSTSVGSCVSYRIESLTRRLVCRLDAARHAARLLTHAVSIDQPRSYFPTHKQAMGGGYAFAHFFLHGTLA